MRTFVMIRSIAGTFPPSGVNLSRVAMKGCFTKPSLACHGARFVQLPVSSSIVLSYASKISQGSLRPPDSYSGHLQRVAQRGANVSYTPSPPRWPASIQCKSFLCELRAPAANRRSLAIDTNHL